MMHVEPARALCVVGWEIKLCAEDLGQRGTPGWCPQPSLSLDFFALGFFCGAEGVQTLSCSSIRTLEITVGLSRDSCIGKDVLLLNGFYPKSSQQSY